MKRRFWIVSILLASASCESHTSMAPPEVGVVEHFGDRSNVVSHPAEVQRALDVVVTVRTFGGGCVSAAGTGIRYHGNTAVIVPYDNEGSRVGDNVNCPDLLTRLTHTVTLRFPREGIATIRVEGRTAPEGRWTTIESTLNVTPLP